MSKKAKMIIAILAIVIAAMMVLPMITAIIPRKTAVEPDDIYYADEHDHEEDIDHVEIDPEIEEARELYKSHLTETILAIDSAEKTGDDRTPEEWYRELTELSGAAGYDRDKTLEAVYEAMSLVEERADFIKKFDAIYKAYKVDDEEREIMETINLALEDYR
ncbi:MAG: hypothetical protein IJS65_08575 [Clostridia bacterium]|nr:hypothetical protein [Clostridia bacterium]